MTLNDVSASARKPACRSCGYDLTGLAVEGVCPECGRPIWDETPPFAPRVQHDAPPAIERLFTTSLYGWSAVTAVLLPPVAIVLSIVLLIAASDASRWIRQENLPPDHRYARQMRRAWWWGLVCFVVSIGVLGWMLFAS